MHSVVNIKGIYIYIYCAHIVNEKGHCIESASIGCPSHTLTHLRTSIAVRGTFVCVCVCVCEVCIVSVTITSLAEGSLQFKRSYLGLRQIN